MATTHDIKEVADQCLELSSKAAQAAIIEACKNGDGMAGATYLASCITAGALLSLAPMLSNRPTYPDHIARKKAKDPNTRADILRFTTPERMVFCALIGAHTFSVISAEEQITQTEAGPHILFAALRDWQKVYPDHKPEEFFDAKMLEAANDWGNNNAAQFEPEMTKRITTSVPLTKN